MLSAVRIDIFVRLWTLFMLSFYNIVERRYPTLIRQTKAGSLVGYTCFKKDGLKLNVNIREG